MVPPPPVHAFRSRAEPGHLLSVLADWNGRRLNTAAIARRLGVSRPTVVTRLRLLEREGLVRLLPFFGGGHRPLLWLRAGCAAGPAAFRAACTEAIINRLQTFLPESRCYWWHAGRIRRIDLLLDTGMERIGFCFARTFPVRNTERIAMRRAHRAGVIHRGFLLQPDSHAYFTARVVVGLPIDAFLQEMEEWVLCRRTARESLDVLVRVNEQEFERLAWERSNRLDSA